MSDSDALPDEDDQPGYEHALETAERTPIGFGVGITAALVSFAAVASYSWIAAATAAGGGLCLAVAWFRTTTRLPRVGGGALAVGTLVAGLAGAPPLAVGIGAWSALVAWDATTFAAAADDMGDATTTAVQLAHVRTTVLVGGAGVAVGAVAFLVGAATPVAGAGLAVAAGTGLVLALVFE